MINSIVKYDDIETDNYIVKDYTSKKPQDIYWLKEINDQDFIDYYRLSDNETIENVAYKLYGSTHYWDVLLMINIADPLFDMVYDFDNVNIQATKFVEDYNNNIYLKHNLPLSYIDYLIDRKISELEALKEERRPLKIIRPSKLLDFMKLIRQQEII